MRLLNKLTDCECLAVDGEAETTACPQAMLDFLREFGEAQSATSPGDADTFVFDSFPEDYDGPVWREPVDG